MGILRTIKSTSWVYVLRGNVVDQYIYPLIDANGAKLSRNMASRCSRQTNSVV